MRSSETFRALGSWRRGGFSGRIRFGSTFRVNGLSVDPMSGSFRSFHLPSGRRAFSTSSGGSPIPCLRIGVEVSNRFMSRRSSRSDKRFKAFSGVVGSSYQARFLLTRLKTPRRTLLESDLLTASPPARCSPTCPGSSIPTRARPTHGQGSGRAQPLAELDPCVRRRPRRAVVPAVGREGSSRPEAGSDQSGYEKKTEGALYQVRP